ALAVLPRRIRTTLDRALLGEALRALQKELRAFPTALTAAWSDVTTHDLNSPTLWRTAAVVRNRRHVLDRFHLKSSGRERLDRGLAAATGTLHANVDTLHTQVERFTRRPFGRDGRRERGALLRTLEAGLSR